MLEYIRSDDFLGAVKIASAWLLGYFVTVGIANGLSGRVAYGLLSGWWFAAYIASKFIVPIKGCIPLGAAFITLFGVTAITGHDWFYSEISGMKAGSMLIIGMLQTLVVISPVLFNAAVTFIFDRHQNSRQ